MAITWLLWFLYKFLWFDIIFTISTLLLSYETILEVEKKKEKPLGVLLQQCLMCGEMKELEDESHCTVCLDEYHKSTVVFRNT